MQIEEYYTAMLIMFLIMNEIFGYVSIFHSVCSLKLVCILLRRQQTRKFIIWKEEERNKNKKKRKRDKVGKKLLEFLWSIEIQAGLERGVCKSLEVKSVSIY